MLEHRPTFDPFNQPAPNLENTYLVDDLLRSYLTRVVPPETLAKLESRLTEMGSEAKRLYQLSLDDRENEPTLVNWDAWGQRIDSIEVTKVWDEAAKIAAKLGVVATAYDDTLGEHARVLQFALAYLFAPSSDVYACPLAMTDGAARTILSSKHERLINRAVPRLTSFDPDEMWTSGQWMTESTGGSDVGKSETIAVKDEEGQWRLYGRKWFTSAAQSQMALTLARPEGNPPGGHGLALFYVETSTEQGSLNNIKIHRLKDKLGTRKLPTAELWLDGTPATLVCDTKAGIRNITPMLAITRTWNAIVAAAGMRRAVMLAKNYSKKRHAFGALLSDKPLHLETLADMECEAQGAFHLSFYLAELIGKQEHHLASEQDMSLLRLLTPIAKLSTGKQAVALASEALECFGGAGYVEDTGLPTLLRDAQVLPIWEGTTNVLSLDTLRALSHGADLQHLVDLASQIASTTEDAALRLAVESAAESTKRACSWIAKVAKDQAKAEAGARRFSLTLARATQLLLLCRHANWSLLQGEQKPRAAALRFAKTPICFIKDEAQSTTELLGR